MNSFEDDCGFWKGKWVLAREGVGEAGEELKAKLETSAKDHPLLSCPMSILLRDSTFHTLQDSETLGPYEMHSKVPTFLQLQGRAALQCINHEGDNDTVKRVESCGVIEVSEDELKTRYGESNVNIVTQFELVAVERMCFIELSPKAMLQALTRETAQSIDLREEAIMRKYMLIVLKHIGRGKKAKGKPIEEKIYLLRGRACYYHVPTKVILSCYEEGYFSGKHLQGSEFKLHIFEGGEYMVLQDDMLKDQVAQGVQSKREQHFRMVQEKYRSMGAQERRKYQDKLIAKYKLNRREVDRQIYGIVEKAVEKVVERKSKNKPELSVTNTSLKEKCGIRIRKTRKVI